MTSMTLNFRIFPSLLSPILALVRARLAWPMSASRISTFVMNYLRTSKLTVLRIPLKVCLPIHSVVDPPPPSSAAGHSQSYFWQRSCRSSQVWYGQDCRLCHCNPPGLLQHRIRMRPSLPVAHTPRSTPLSLLTLTNSPLRSTRSTAVSPRTWTFAAKLFMVVFYSFWRVDNFLPISIIPSRVVKSSSDAESRRGSPFHSSLLILYLQSPSIGNNYRTDVATAQSNPTVLIGTPGRINKLLQDRKLDLTHLKHIVLDECDKLLEELCMLFSCVAHFLAMRNQVQRIFLKTNKNKQIMMFTATLNDSTSLICKKFMKDVSIYSLWVMCLALWIESVWRETYLQELASILFECW